MCPAPGLMSTGSDDVDEKWVLPLKSRRNTKRRFMYFRNGNYFRGSVNTPGPLPIKIEKTETIEKFLKLYTSHNLVHHN